LIKGDSVKAAAKHVHSDIDAFKMLAYETLDLWDIVASNYREIIRSPKGIADLRSAALSRHAEILRSNPSVRRTSFAIFSEKDLLARLDKWRVTFLS